MVCPLDTVAVTELWRLELFSCTSFSFSCAGTLFPRGKCCYFFFAEGLVGVDKQTCLSNGFSGNFCDSITGLYSRSITRQCRSYSKT